MLPGGSRTADFGTVGKRSNNFATRPLLYVVLSLIQCSKLIAEHKKQTVLSIFLTMTDNGINFMI